MFGGASHFNENNALRNGVWLVRLAADKELILLRKFAA